MRSITCEYCGGSHETRSKTARFCSLSCSNHARAERRPCKWCGETYRFLRSNRRVGKYCSRECYFAHKSAKAARGSVRKRWAKAERWIAGQIKKARRAAVCRICVICGEENKHHKGRKCCNCQIRPRVWTSTHCGTCGRYFYWHRKKNKPDPRNCRACARTIKIEAKKREKARHGSNRGRAKSAGVAYEPINKRAIFEAYGWRCVRCKRLTSTGRPTTDDLYPELDHIIPMSAGGPHLRHNVWLLCRACNADKSSSDPVGWWYTPAPFSSLAPEFLETAGKLRTYGPANRGSLI